MAYVLGMHYEMSKPFDDKSFKLLEDNESYSDEDSNLKSD